MSNRTTKRLTPSVQVGDKVFLLGWKHLFGSKTKPRKYGFVERINGGYVYVRPTGWPKNRPAFELYHSEFRVVKRYHSRQFQIGERVLLKNPKSLDWGRGKPRDRVLIVGVKGSYLVVLAMGGPYRQFTLRARDLERGPHFVEGRRRASADNNAAYGERMPGGR